MKTWEDVIQACNEGINQLHIFILEDSNNKAYYEHKIAILELYKQDAIKHQNEALEVIAHKMTKETS